VVDNLYRGLIREILAIFCEIDHKIGLLQREASIHCPPGCGLCYQKEAVETTVLECLPLANVIYSRGEEETILSVIAERVNCGDSRCALFGPEKQSLAMAGAPNTHIARWYVDSLDLHPEETSLGSWSTASAGSPGRNTRKISPLRL